MSMSILSALQLAGISAVYFISVLLLPWLFLRKRLAGFGSVPVRFMIYVLAGNFYIINLVYLLQILHISCWLTLCLGTLAPFIVETIVKYRGSCLGHLEKGLARFLLILGGETGRKTLFLHIKKKLERFFRAVGKKLKQCIRSFGLEIILVAGLIALLLYMYGSNAVNVYGYGVSDIVSHNYWINEMGRNHIFADGVYPFGMHCLLYYLHVLFGIHTEVLLRLFYVIQTVMIHLVLLAFLRCVCKSRYAPYIGIIVYIVTNRLYHYIYIRYQATLPQEMGMIFILPAAYFAMAFLGEKNLTLGFGNSGDDVEAEGVKKGKGCRFQIMTVSGFYLILFAVSVSLTLTVHFYDTLITGIFCIAIGVGFCFRVFRWEYFKRIVAAGLAGILIAVVPLAVAFITGTPLQASLKWGTAQWETSVSEGMVQNTDMSAAEEENPEKMSVFETVVNRMEYFVANDRKTAQVILEGIGLLFALGLLWFLIWKTDYGAMLISCSLYMGILAVLLASEQLGIMQFMDISRYSIYLGYGIPVVLSLCVDAVLFILLRKEKILNFCSMVLLIAVCAVAIEAGVRKPIYLSACESNEAITCLNNIIRENKKETWTICSANDERPMVGDYSLGYHYELIDFIRDMRSYDQDTMITIPTSTVYFFIEKVPLLYLDYMNTEKPERRVSLEAAKEPISEKSGIKPYMGYDRWVTMSHMYYWAQAFQELYPNEMEVYYESDNFICYRVRQNEYSLYNFAIDYGYNGTVKKKD